jgi:hypothetical protein
MHGLPRSPRAGSSPCHERHDALAALRKRMASVIPAQRMSPCRSGTSVPDLAVAHQWSRTRSDLTPFLGPLSMIVREPVAARVPAGCDRRAGARPAIGGSELALASQVLLFAAPSGTCWRFAYRVLAAESATQQELSRLAEAMPTAQARDAPPRLPCSLFTLAKRLSFALVVEAGRARTLLRHRRAQSFEPLDRALKVRKEEAG